MQANWHHKIFLILLHGPNLLRPGKGGIIKRRNNTCIRLNGELSAIKVITILL
jgi:hypothetical protein